VGYALGIKVRFRAWIRKLDSHRLVNKPLLRRSGAAGKGRKPRWMALALRTDRPAL